MDSTSGRITPVFIVLAALVGLASGCAVGGGYGSYGDDDDLSNDDDATGCVEHIQCDGDEFCSENECELVFGRSFEVIFWAADIEPFDGSGSDWDLTGAPDPFGVLSIDGEEVFETDVVDDSLTADWGESANVVVTQQTLCIEVWDEDLAADDLMDARCFSTQESIVDLVRDGEFVGFLTDELVSIDVEVLPNF